MGLGLHGGGVAVVKWLVKHDAKVTVTDLKSRDELKSSLEQLKGLKIRYVLGKHREVDFKKVDFIVQNPGVPRESKYLKIVQKAGIPRENEASLFFKFCPGSIIGVTGTRGKSTTATLIYELLKNCYSGSRLIKFWLAGLPQKPMLEILDSIKSSHRTILELSSWQLEILGQQQLSPQVAVITNIYPDHLNRYSGMKDYIAAKKQIFSWQIKTGHAVFNLDNKETKELGKMAIGHRYWFSKKYFPEQNGCFIKKNNIIFRRYGKEVTLANLKVIKLLGEHNLENILAALTVAGIYNICAGISGIQKVESVLKNFTGLPGRLEEIRQAKGIKYINDTTSTMPDATIAALKSQVSSFSANGGFSPGGKSQNPKVILIAGGSDKGIPGVKFDELAREIKKTCKAVILFKGSGSEKIKKSLEKFKVTSYKFQDITTMADAIGIAQALARKGDIVLLSPACASFGLFIHEFDRGDQFRKVVNSL